MSLWKLRVGVESYYLAQVASGLDEYYTGAGEAVGRWTGTGAPLLGELNTRDVTGLATRITAAAAHHDRHGQLPEHWVGQPPAQSLVPTAAIEFGR